MTFAFDRGVIAGSVYDGDGFLTLQVDTYSDGSSPPGGPFGEVQLPYGEYGRPCDPDLDADGVPRPESSCQTLYWWDGPRLHVQPMQDPRIIPFLPKLTPGSKVWYVAGPKGSFRPIFLHFDADTYDATLYVPYTDGSKAHVISLSTSGDNITLRHAAGGGVSITSDELVMNGPDGSTYVQLSNGGAGTFNGNLRGTAGASFGADPLPLAQAVPVVAGMGVSGVATTALAAMAAAISTAQAAIGTFAGANPTLPGATALATAMTTVVAAMATAQAAMTAATAGMAAQAALVPSLTTSGT